MVEQLRNYAKKKETLRISLDIDNVRVRKIEFLKKVTGIRANIDLFRALIDSSYDEAVKEETI